MIDFFSLALLSSVLKSVIFSHFVNVTFGNFSKMAVFATFQNIVFGGLPVAFSSYPLPVVFGRGYAK